jgi:putative aminopeptidase FrvX
MENLTYVQNLLVKLLNTPSPTGDTEDVIRMLEQECEVMGYEHQRNRKGGLLVTVPGADDREQRLLTAHVDTLGAMVKEILKSGRLRLTKIGGYAWNTVEGEYCQVQTRSGSIVTGTVILHNTSVHVNAEVGTTERTSDNIEVVLDAKVSSKEEVRALGIEVGDFVAWDPRVEVTHTDYIKSRHLDDKASVAILFGILREIHSTRMKLPHTVTVLISNNGVTQTSRRKPSSTWRSIWVPSGKVKPLTNTVFPFAQKTVRDLITWVCAGT